MSNLLPPLCPDRVSHDTYFVTWLSKWQASEILLDKWSLNGDGEWVQETQEGNPREMMKGHGVHTLCSCPHSSHNPVASRSVIEIKLSYILCLCFVNPVVSCVVPGAEGLNICSKLRVEVVSVWSWIPWSVTEARSGTMSPHQGTKTGSC